MFETKKSIFPLQSLFDEQNEIQKLIITSINENHNLTELLPELFDPKITTPTAPKPGIFKTIFSATPFDRDQLCKI